MVIRSAIWASGVCNRKPDLLETECAITRYGLSDLS